MPKIKQISTAKPKMDKTRKMRADRRKGFLDVAGKRAGMLSWGSIEKWARECVEEPTADQGVNNRLRDMFFRLANGIPGGDPNIPPADVMRVRELYPVGGLFVSTDADKEMARRILDNIRSEEKDEAGRLATGPKADEIFKGDHQ